MRLQDFMETRVFTVTSTSPAEEAWALMQLHRCHHLVVQESHAIVGVLSARDLGGEAGGALRRNLSVGEMMTTDVVVGTPDMTVRQAANLLRGRTIGSLPIMSDGRLVGIVTVTNLLELRQGVGTPAVEGATRHARRARAAAEDRAQTGREMDASARVMSLDDAVEAAPNVDRVLLEGRHSRRRELWLVLRAVRDFISGFRVLHFVGPCVTVFGSARFGADHPAYEIAREVGRRVATLGFTVMTGGGPGLMEAANRGAKDVGGQSVGCNIRLPREQEPNPYLDRSVTCEHFFVRKVLLFKYSYAFIALPGGIGTVDELFEALTLIQTRKIEHFPVVLLGTAYWQPLLHMLRAMVTARAIDASDLDLVLVTDDVEEAMRHITTHAIQRFGLRRRAPRAWRLFGERPPAPGADLAQIAGGSA